MLFLCLFCLLSRGSAYHVCMSLGFTARGTDWQCHLLGHHGQLFLHYWRTWFDTCLLGFVWGVVAGSENWLAKFPPLLCIEIGR